MEHWRIVVGDVGGVTTTIVSAHFVALPATKVLTQPDAVVRSDQVTPAIRDTEGFQSALDAWQASRADYDKTRKTNARKQANAVRFALTRMGVARLGDVSSAQVSLWLTQYGAGRSGKTVATMLSYLAAFFEWATASGCIQVDPIASVRRPALTRKGKTAETPRRLLDAEVGQLVAVARADEALPTPRFEHPRADLYELWRLTGAREGQLCRQTTEPDDPGLRWRNVHEDDAEPHVWLRDSKNGDDWRIPLHPRAVEILSAWRKRCEVASPDHHVFPWRFQDRWFDADLEAAGIPKHCPRTGRTASVQSLRRSYCTDFALKGVPMAVAQRLMQHRNIQMTVKVYTEVMEEEQARLGIARLSDVRLSTIRPPESTGLAPSGGPSILLNVTPAYHHVDDAQAPGQSGAPLVSRLTGPGPGPDRRQSSERAAIPGDVPGTADSAECRGPESHRPSPGRWPDASRSAHDSVNSPHLGGTHGPLPEGRPTDLGSGGGFDRGSAYSPEGAGAVLDCEAGRGDGRGSADPRRHEPLDPAPEAGGTRPHGPGPRLGPEAGDFERPAGDRVGSGLNPDSSLLQRGVADSSRPAFDGAAAWKDTRELTQQRARCGQPEGNPLEPVSSPASTTLDPLPRGTCRAVNGPASQPTAASGFVPATGAAPRPPVVSDIASELAATRHALNESLRTIAWLLDLARRHPLIVLAVLGALWLLWPRPGTVPEQRPPNVAGEGVGP